MTAQNVQNNIAFQPVQNLNSVQTLPIYAPAQKATVPPVSGAVQSNISNNYIPRYMPLIQNGQVYPVAVPQQPPQTQCGQPLANGASVGAVNITINGVAQGPANPNPQCCTSYVPYVVPQPPASLPAQEIKKEVTEAPKDPLPASTIEKKPEEKKPEEKSNKKPVKELTDGYIKELEKNLNNKDKDTRIHAVADLVNRFKEDESRKDDPRLTNLLNLALEDESKPIVYAAMQAIDNGYANGNAVTEQRLQAIKDKHDNFGNSETAEGILARIAEKKASTKVPEAAAVPIKGNTENIDSTPGKKLNLMAG